MGFFDNAFGGIASGLFGGISNLIGSNSANKTNIRIARENNQMQMQMAKDNMAWQEQMMNRQNQWNLDQWNRENEYNSAASQVARFREAGINPALAMTQGASAGQASSMQSAQPANSPGLPNLQAPNIGYADLTDNFAQIGNAIDQSRLISSQIAKNSADSNAAQVQATYYKTLDDVEHAKMPGYHAQSRGYQLDNISRSWRNMMSQYDYKLLKLDYGFRAATQQNNIEATRLQNEKLRGEIVNNGLDADAKVIANTYLPAKLQSELASSAADRAYKRIQGMYMGEILPFQQNKLRSEELNSIASAIKAYREANNLPDLKDDDVRRLTEAYVNSAEENAREAAASARLRELEENLKRPKAEFYRKHPSLGLALDAFSAVPSFVFGSAVGLSSKGLGSFGKKSSFKGSLRPPAAPGMPMTDYWY